MARLSYKLFTHVRFMLFSGEDNAEIPHPIIFRGAVFADTARFDRCTSLWMRAMHLRFKNNRSIAKDLIRFAQVTNLEVRISQNKEDI